MKQPRYRELGGKPIDRVEKFAKALSGAKNNGELYSRNARFMKHQRPFQLNDPIKRLSDGGILYAPTSAMLNIMQRRRNAQPVSEDMLSKAHDEYLGMHATLSPADAKVGAAMMRDIANGYVVPGVKIVAHHEPAYALAAQFLHQQRQ